MGRGWVHGVRVVAAAKKGKIFTKIAKEIAVSVKMGGASPESNARLRSALRDAQKNSVPKDTVERAIKRGLGGGNEALLEESTYEGYGPHGVAALVETLSDNKNRTVQDLRSAFTRSGGSMGETNSVGWMFDRIGSVIAHSAKKGDIEEAAIMVGANEVEALEEDQVHFICTPSDLDSVTKALGEQGWEILKSELAYKAKTPKELTPEQEKDVQEFLEMLNDNDDVKRVHLSV
jgi:YebC/PmpR family DNA-binding regulatory protein